MLEALDLRVCYGARTVLDGVGFSVREGDWLMIAGPNGAGKSTALGALAQSVPYAGRVLISGRDARRMPARERARWMGTLTQNHFVGYAFTVEEVVRLGRYAYAGALGGRARADEQAVEDALLRTGMAGLRGHSVLTLSGGELQRAFLAQVFAQNPRVLLLDEPANHLDLPYQQQVFGLIREWLQTPGRAAVSVVHDLSLALCYGTRALLLREGRVVADAPAREALAPDNLRQAYDMDVHGWMRGLLAQWEQRG
ncbi:MAG: ABC transporter ATP-binding protein [Clostridiales bacterium]|nr:ABC transporter ATP-binding protein [Clostridiales bacterium]